MIRDGLDALVGKSPGRPITRGIVICALDDVKQMRVHAVANEGMTVLVPVDAPRIGRADGERLPHVTYRMIPPHATLEPPPIGPPRPRFARQRPVRNPVRAVQPTVRPPRKPVGDGMRIGMRTKTVEQQDRLPIWHTVVILIRNEIKIRNRHHPHPAEPNFYATHILKFIVKNNPLIMGTIAVGILENNDAVIFSSLLVRIIIGFSHPQPTPIIKAETNRLLDVRFSGKKGDVEPLGHLHRLRSL